MAAIVLGETTIALTGPPLSDVVGQCEAEKKAAGV